MKKLVLKHELYSERNIAEAKKAYKDIANIIVSQQSEHFVIRFFHCRYDDERTVKEFENYLIGLENMQA